MKKIGILGGTFNPIHIGHLAMAEVARDRCGLDRVVFVPCFQPPHKRITRLTKPADRFQMVKLAVQGHPSFDVSDAEIKRRGKSYSIDTVRHFRRVLPKSARLFYIIGADNFQYLDSWKDIEAILEQVTFLVINRPGMKARGPKIKHLRVRMPGLDISGSYLRRCLQSGHSVRYLVPEKVRQFIIRKKLYKK